MITNRPSRVLLITTGLAYGGAETQLMRLALRIKSRGWRVSVVSMTPPKAYLEELQAADVPVYSLDIRRKIPDPRPILRLARLIRSFQPDIIHSYMVHANILARLIRPLAQAPVLICSARSTNEGGRFREHLYRLTDPLCDLTTQVSRTGMERYVRVRATPQHKIRYIPNGVDTNCFRPDHEVRKHMYEILGLRAAFTWLAVGRFDIPKDYPNMLRAFSHVVQAQPDTSLIIVGDGPLRPPMEDLAVDLGLKDRVMFLGICRNISELMNVADGYVISSAWEGMANVLLEAAATGLPIIATDVGGNRDVVQNGETGFLVPPKDSESLARGMLQLMDLSIVERRRMGVAGRSYIEATYSMDQVVNMWESLYREFLAEKGIDDRARGEKHAL